MSHRRRVYVCGPYTLGDVADNVRVAIETAHILMNAGCAPYVPHLTHFWHIHRPRQYEEWIALDLEWLRLCDVVVRIPGQSRGADLECAEAARLGIPVKSLDEFLS